MSNVFFYEPFYDLERIADEVLSTRQSKQGNQDQRDSVNGAVRSVKPRMDLHEDSEKNLVTAVFEFPGITKENIQINVHNGKLTVSAETKQSEELQKEGYAVRERQFGKYSRTLQLPQGINEEEIKASMENGLLTITFPRTTPELAPKRINIA